MNVVLIQLGAPHESLILTCLLVGLKKHHSNSKIIWAGNNSFKEMVTFNKRINQFVNISEGIDLSLLSAMYGADLCINVSPTKKAKEIASAINAKKYYGFIKRGPVDKNAEFFLNVMTGKVKTNKTVLNLYYNLAGMKWKGEGYGISYYPRTKQTKQCGRYLIHGNYTAEEKCESFKLPKELLKKFDVINQFSEIITDDEFSLHASLALRKHTTFISEELSYKMEFFRKGKMAVRQSEQTD